MREDYTTTTKETFSVINIYKGCSLYNRNQDKITRTLSTAIQLDSNNALANEYIYDIYIYIYIYIYICMYVCMYVLYI